MKYMLNNITLKLKVKNNYLNSLLDRALNKGQSDYDKKIR